MPVLIFERNRRNVWAESSIFIQRILRIASQPDTVLSDWGEYTKFFSSVLAMLVDSCNFVPDVNYRNVEDLLIPSFGRTPFWSVRIPFCQLPTEDFLGSSRRFSGHNAESAYDDNIWLTPLKVSKLIAIVLINQCVNFNLFVKSAHVIQYHWSMPVLALVLVLLWQTVLALPRSALGLSPLFSAILSFRHLITLSGNLRQSSTPIFVLRLRWNFLLLLASSRTLRWIASSKTFSAVMYLLRILNSWELSVGKSKSSLGSLGDGEWMRWP